jgi:hypothetical protein
MTKKNKKKLAFSTKMLYLCIEQLIYYIMPYKDFIKQRIRNKENYYKNREAILRKSKEKYMALSSEDKEKFLMKKRITYKKHYQDNKSKIQERRKKNYIDIKLKSLYKMTIQDYENILNLQDKKCAICKNEKSSYRYKNMKLPLCVDHNHVTNQVRGLLCHKCNAMIGLAGEDIIILTNAINYLKKWKRE